MSCKSKRQGPQRDCLGPCAGVLCLLSWWLGAIGSAASLALARVLSLATIVTGFTAALSLAGILSLAGMLILEEAAASAAGKLSVARGNGSCGVSGLGDGGIARHETG